MIRVVILPVLLLLTFSQSKAQVVEYADGAPTLASMGLTGKIDTIRESYYRVKYNTNASPYKQALDSAADIHYYYELIGENIYAFNKMGQLTQRILFDTVDNKQDKTNYNYSKDGQLTSIANYEGSKRTDSTLFKNNKSKVTDRRMNISNVAVYDAKGKPVGSTMYTYSNGNLITIRRRDKENTIIEMIRYKYDKGRLIEKSVHTGNLQLVRKSEITTEKKEGDNTYITEMEYTKKGKFYAMRSYINDARGNVLEQTITDSNKRVIEHRISKYNLRNEVIEQKVFTDTKRDYKYRYAYDALKNRTKQEIYIGDSLITVIERSFIPAQ